MKIHILNKIYESNHLRKISKNDDKIGDEKELTKYVLETRSIQVGTFANI